MRVHRGGREVFCTRKGLSARRPAGVTGMTPARSRRRSRAARWLAVAVASVPLAAAELGNLHALGGRDEGLDMVGVFEEPGG